MMSSILNSIMVCAMVGVASVAASGKALWNDNKVGLRKNNNKHDIILDSSVERTNNLRSDFHLRMTRVKSLSSSLSLSGSSDSKSRSKKQGASYGSTTSTAVSPSSTSSTSTVTSASLSGSAQSESSTSTTTTPTTTTTIPTTTTTTTTSTTTTTPTTTTTTTTPTTIATTTTAAPLCDVQYYTLADVQANADRFTSCWYVLYGTVYDMTIYIDDHPGGSRKIFENCGTDATSLFQAEDLHDKQLLADKLPAEYTLGKLGTVSGIIQEPC